MNQWVELARQVLDMAVGFGRQPGPAERLVVAAVGAITGMVTLKVCVKGAGMTDLGMMTQMMAILGGALVVIFSAAAAMIYLVPMVSGQSAVTAVRIAAPVAGFLIAGVPLAAALLHGSYGKTLVSLVLSAVILTLVMLAVHSMFGSARGEYKEMNKIRDRTSIMDRELNRR